MNYVPDCYQKPTLILGCGNELFGDDGFGPAVIRFLEKHFKPPKDVSILDVGTGAREILFNIILAEKKPERIIIIDALDCNRELGEVFTVSIEDIPERKLHDFSVHQMPTLNMLKELRDLCHVEVVVLAAQPEYVPEVVKPGLSKKLQDAVPKVGEYIVKNYF
ncbi:MAG: hydrogenase maturation protease [Dehalococcoidales bacterium]|nr:hydrogenase maturation protease [Dehalococcoidales bacterium]